MNNVRIEKSIELSDWIVRRYETIPFISDGRVELAVTCYYITWQHHAAIAQLCHLGLFASATALIRCAWDSYTRGMWLHHAATSEQLENFKQKGDMPKGKQIFLELQTAIPEIENQFIKKRESTYSRLCDFTHTGIGQIGNHFISGEITADLGDSAINDVLHFVETLALSALSYSALIAKNQEVANCAFDRMRVIEES
jgi:hypothetical protein